jgi:hypothetical protein
VNPLSPYPQDVIAKRRHGSPPVTQYLIHWKGYSASSNTWEPSEHVPPALISEFNESRMGLQEETDTDDSMSEHDSDEEGEASVVSAPARGKRPAAEGAAAPPAKKAAVRTGASRKRAAPAVDSSDEEQPQQPAKRGKAAPPKPKPQGKGKGKSKRK